MSVTYSICLSPVLFLCANNFEIRMFVLIKKWQKIRKMIPDGLFETYCIDDNDKDSIYSEAHNNR